MSRTATYAAAGLVAIAFLVSLAVMTILPRLDWGAAAQPSWIEEILAGYVIDRWVEHNATNRPNPIPANSENLKLGRSSYEEHCGACHGLDGGGTNRLEADFYPRVTDLTGDTQELSDAQIYFIIAKGIRHTAMPSFETHHKPNEIWRTVLWVRHLAALDPQEKAALQARSAAERREHSHLMEESGADSARHRQKHDNGRGTAPPAHRPPVPAGSRP